MATLYVLDTNVLVHHARSSALWVHIRDTYDPLTADPRPIVSVVSEGELRSLAAQWKWGQKKLIFDFITYRLVTLAKTGHQYVHSA